MFFAQQRSALVPLHSPQGCPQGANAHMGFLDIKHVQLDTMAGHFLLPALLAFPPTAPAPNQQVQQQQAQQGQGKGKGKGGSSSSSSGGVRAAKGGAPVALPTQGQELLVRMCTFFSDHCKDAGESLFTAYTSGVYSKVGPHCGFFPLFSPALSSVAVPAYPSEACSKLDQRRSLNYTYCLFSKVGPHCAILWLLLVAGGLLQAGLALPQARQAPSCHPHSRADTQLV